MAADKCARLIEHGLYLRRKANHGCIAEHTTFGTGYDKALKIPNAGYDQRVDDTGGKDGPCGQNYAAIRFEDRRGNGNGGAVASFL
jgi:hypothetical protein